MTDTTIDLFPHLFEGATLIRHIMRDGEPWFVAVDVCRALGLKDTNKAVQALAEDEKGAAIIRTLGGIQELIVISESGLYALVLRSHAALRPETFAYRFRRWVTSDLLPQIRKTGSYGRPVATLASLSIMEKDKLVNTACRIGGPRAGVEAWRFYGLPNFPAFEQIFRQGVFTFDATPADPDQPLN